MSTAADHAYRHIRGEILAGTLGQGARLSEEQLADACGVSRTPVRDALRRLEAERLVRRTESQRCFVAVLSADDIAEGFALRGMLEAYAARRAGERIDAAAIESLGAHNRAMAGAARRSVVDLDSFLAHNRAFHDGVLAAAASEQLAMLLAGVVEQPIVLGTARRYDRAGLEKSLAEHDELIQAFSRRDPDWAHAVMAAHIRRAFHAYADALAPSTDRAARPTFVPGVAA